MSTLRGDRLTEITAEEEKIHKAINLLFALSRKEECVACTLTHMPCVTSRTCSPGLLYSIQERRVTVLSPLQNEAEVKGATFMQKRKLVFQVAIESHTAIINPSSPLLLKERFDD